MALTSEQWITYGCCAGAKAYPFRKPQETIQSLSGIKFILHLPVVSVSSLSRVSLRKYSTTHWRHPRATKIFLKFLSQNVLSKASQNITLSHHACPGGGKGLRSGGCEWHY